MEKTHAIQTRTATEERVDSRTEKRCRGTRREPKAIESCDIASLEQESLPG